MTEAVTFQQTKGSRHTLQWINFFLADAREGVGADIFGTALTILGLGASFSTIFSGVSTDLINYDDAFLVLAGVAVIALIVFAVFMPETKGYEHPNSWCHSL
jgi:hypothetical protein